VESWHCRGRGGCSAAGGRRGSADEGDVGGLGLERDAAEELEEARKVGAGGSTAAVAASAAVGCTHWPYSWSGVTASRRCSPTTRQAGDGSDWTRRARDGRGLGEGRRRTGPPGAGRV
jgi:hypothetical protein